MKVLRYIFAACLLAAVLHSCDQDIDFPYEGKDRIQFEHYTVNYNSVRNYTDSVVFSFGLLNDSIKVDTAKIPMEFLGKGSDQTRTYKVVVVPDSTNAVAGVHYEKFDELQTFRAGEFHDTLRIVVYREKLSTSFRNPQTIRLDLKLEPTDDFDLGLAGGIQRKVLLNNYLSEPDWWTSHMGLGYYHPKKWKILISFNEGYANQHTCSFNYNNDGRSYVQGLNRYLNEIPTFDDETGERLYLNEMVAQE